MALRESDKPIVVKKPGNAGGAKGLTVMPRDLRDRTAGHGTGAQFSTGLKSLTLRAKRSPRYRFISLMHLFTEDFLLVCFRELARGKAPGIDAVTVTEYEANLEDNIGSLVTRLKARRYRPQPVRRVYIPKPNGKKRPLGVPAVEDKVVQMACKKILEAIFEGDFLPVSYGFRPGRSCQAALVDLDRTIMTRPVNYVVDADIERFFDTVNHEWLMKCLRQRIVDSVFLRLIARFLKVGAVTEGRHIRTDEGTPQGSIISPVLANVYLHYILDLWFERRIKRRLKGYGRLIRYADDFVVCFQSECEAGEFEQKLRQRLSGFGLKIAEGKSRTIEFGRYRRQAARGQGERLATFDFLGFTHYCDETRKGGFKLSRKTARTRLNRALVAINEWLKMVRNRMRVREWWPILEAKLRGHYNYYGLSGNMRSLRCFYYRTVRMVYKWLNRRSQKGSYDWEQFCRWLRYNPLPRPRICHG
jgi:RNA-directed DNA polymerase